MSKPEIVPQMNRYNEEDAKKRYVMIRLPNHHRNYITYFILSQIEIRSNMSITCNSHALISGSISNQDIFQYNLVSLVYIYGCKGLILTDSILVLITVPSRDLSQVPSQYY